MDIDNAPSTSGVEEVYVVVELEGVDLPGPGTSMVLKDLDSANPTLKLEDGTTLHGSFEETVGTQLVFGDQIISRDGSHVVQLRAHTDKRLRFSKSEAPPS